MEMLYAPRESISPDIWHLSSTFFPFNTGIQTWQGPYLHSEKDTNAQSLADQEVRGALWLLGELSSAPQEQSGFLELPSRRKRVVRWTDTQRDTQWTPVLLAMLFNVSSPGTRHVSEQLSKCPASPWWTVPAWQPRARPPGGASPEFLTHIWLMMVSASSHWDWGWFITQKEITRVSILTN